jgi:molybdopterin-guanine dinucleotide biosynthesis protein A
MLHRSTLAAAILAGGKATRLGGLNKATLALGRERHHRSPAAFIRRLADEDADVVMPRSHRGYEPLCAIYSRVCAPDIRARIDRGELEASTAPAGVRIVEIGPDIIAEYDRDDSLFMNVNTPHDYERARSRSSTADPITTDRAHR